VSLSDPLEANIADALLSAGIRFDHEASHNQSHRLDFHLWETGVAIEIKRFHSERISDQMSRTENVIVAQGKEAVELLAKWIAASGRGEASTEQPS